MIYSQKLINEDVLKVVQFWLAIIKENGDDCQKCTYLSGLEKLGGSVLTRPRGRVRDMKNNMKTKI